MLSTPRRPSGQIIEGPQASRRYINYQAIRKVALLSTCLLANSRVSPVRSAAHKEAHEEMDVHVSCYSCSQTDVFIGVKMCAPNFAFVPQFSVLASHPVALASDAMASELDFICDSWRDSLFVPLESSWVWLHWRVAIKICYHRSVGSEFPPRCTMLHNFPNLLPSARILEVGNYPRRVGASGNRSWSQTESSSVSECPITQNSFGNSFSSCISQCFSKRVSNKLGKQCQRTFAAQVVRKSDEG